MNWNAMLTDFAQAQIDAAQPAKTLDLVDEVWGGVREVEECIERLQHAETELLRAMNALKEANERNS